MPALLSAFKSGQLEAIAKEATKGIQLFPDAQGSIIHVEEYKVQGMDKVAYHIYMQESPEEDALAQRIMAEGSAYQPRDVVVSYELTVGTVVHKHMPQDVMLTLNYKGLTYHRLRQPPQAAGPSRQAAPPLRQEVSKQSVAELQQTLVQLAAQVAQGAKEAEARAEFSEAQQRARTAGLEKLANENFIKQQAVADTHARMADEHMKAMPTQIVHQIEGSLAAALNAASSSASVLTKELLGVLKQGRAARAGSELSWREVRV